MRTAGLLTGLILSPPNYRPGASCCPAGRAAALGVLGPAGGSGPTAEPWEGGGSLGHGVDAFCSLPHQKAAETGSGGFVDPVRPSSRLSQHQLQAGRPSRGSSRGLRAPPLCSPATLRGVGGCAAGGKGCWGYFRLSARGVSPAKNPPRRPREAAPHVLPFLSISFCCFFFPLLSLSRQPRTFGAGCGGRAAAWEFTLLSAKGNSPSASFQRS